MHLGNGAITLECAAIGFAAAGAGIGYSAWRVATQHAKRPESTAVMVLRAVALGSLVFAAQMLNVPVLASSSAHFVGGILLAELLGPALGVLTMSAVLFLQATLLGDGGLAALGVNIANMALLPAGSLLLGRRLVRNHSLALVAASALSVVLAVLLIAGEVGLGRSVSELSNWSSFVSAMLINHLPLLALEGALTLALVALWRQGEKVDLRSTWRIPAMAAAAALMIAVFAAAASSELPDGYESAAESSQMQWLMDSQ